MSSVPGRQIEYLDDTKPGTCGLSGKGMRLGLKYRVIHILTLGFQIPLPYLLEDLRSAAARAQENLSRDLSVSLQKVWARKLRRKMMKEEIGLVQRERDSLGVCVREAFCKK